MNVNFLLKLFVLRRPMSGSKLSRAHVFKRLKIKIHALFIIKLKRKPVSENLHNILKHVNL